MTNNDRILFDNFCRAVLLDYLNKSKYAGNKKIQDYIVHEASYEKVVKAAIHGVISEDASSDIKLSKAEENFKDIFAYGVAMFAAPPLEKYTKLLISKGFKSYTKKTSVKGFTGKVKGKVTKQFAGRGGTPGTFVMRGMNASSTILTYMGVSLGLSLLVKVIFAILKRIVSKCRKTCGQQISNKVSYRSLKISICTSKCKIQDLKYHIGRLRAEVKKCKNISSNPEDCQQNIINQIARMNKILEKEEKKLKGDTRHLREKEQAKKKRGRK